MKRRAFYRATLSIAAMAGWVSRATSADLESFEFGDAAGTPLASAVNTANSGNQWVEDLQMFPSDVRGGSYNIVKESTALDSNFLQIANITSGTRYLVARVSGWKFGDTIDPANLEEVRFAFLNDDDSDFGSTITAQMMIRRNSDGTVELVGDAIGAGSSNISGGAFLETTRTTPLTLALELNKSSNTYKVFYKDDASPTQVLGLGSVAPTRDGNSLRLSANNSFGEGNLDYPFVPADEFFAVDRIALTDTQPFTDLITLEIDRASGALTLRNTSGAGLTGLESYSITSPNGAFDPTKWRTVTGNYDSGGSGSVDNAPWAITSSTKSLLSEAFQSGDGGGLTNGQDVELSVPAGGTWLQSPLESVTMALNFTAGVTRTVNVNFVGNGGAAWAVGDLNFDGDITAADYSFLVSHAETSLAGLTRVEAYRRGDLDGDGVNSIGDFLQFKTIYNAANGGEGAFEIMLAGIPEPGTLTLLAAAAGVVAVGGRRRRRVRGTPGLPATQISTDTRNPLRDATVIPSAPLFRWMLAIVALAAAAPGAGAAILEDFPFSDSNGTLLADAENVANSGNNWVGEMNASSILNGAYRVQKGNTALETLHLDIANITTGKAWLVAEIAGWSFSSMVGPDEFDSGEPEEIRFAFLDNDTMPPSGSMLSGQARFLRTNTGGLELVGNTAGTGGSNVPGSYVLPLTRSTPFTVVLEVNVTDAIQQYSVYYKDDAADFALLGMGNIAPGRNANSMRFGTNNSLAGTGEFFDVSRIYLTDTDPIGVVEPVALTLEAKSNGMLSIVNGTEQSISFDTYRIASATSALNFGGWNSLSNQGIDAVEGGDDPGENWTVAAGSNDGVLAESFLLGQSSIAPQDMLSLGDAFKVGGDQNLVFQYRDTVTGTLVIGGVEYITVAGVLGDYNNNGVVDAADYTAWRDNLGGPDTALQNRDPMNSGNIDQTDYDFWKSRFGATSGAGSGSLAGNAAVPEPASLVLVLVGFALGCLRCVPRRRAFFNTPSSRSLHSCANDQQ